MRAALIIWCAVLTACVPQKQAESVPQTQVPERTHYHTSATCDCANPPQAVASVTFPNFCEKHGGGPELCALGQCARCGGETSSCSHLICRSCAEAHQDCRACGAHIGASR